MSTRDRILDAGEDVLEKRGLEGLTVDSVMRRVNVSRTSFYRFFHNKEELLLALFERSKHELAASVESWLKGEESLQVALEGVIRAFAKRGVVWATVRGQDEDEPLRALYEEMLKEYNDMVAYKIFTTYPQVENPALVATALNNLDDGLWNRELTKNPSEREIEDTVRTTEAAWVPLLGA